MHKNNQGISVVICCHNSCTKIEATLNAMALQMQQPDIGFEIIVVDNCCTDNTVNKTLQHWDKLGNLFPLTVVEEPTPGLSYARQKGINAAAFEYIILCDDDNWLCNDYLLKAFTIFEAQPEAALLGGVGEAVFEGNICPVWFKKLDGFGYAVGDEGRTTGFTSTVYGAGMGIRKTVFNKLIGANWAIILSDRKGNSLSSGGDTEICLIIKNAGHKIYFDQSLKFKHFISANRLQWNYYLKLRRSFGFANAYLAVYKNEKLGHLSGKDFYRNLLQFYYFIFRNLHFFLFPFLFKTGRCAWFIQNLSLKRTLLFERNQILFLTKKMMQLN